MLVWKELYEFPGYSVSSSGVVRNDGRDSVLARLVNNRGVTYVGLFRDGVQHKRAVAPLVAKAFIDRPSSPFFDTPIHLDGDRINTAASNLLWRPKWFAVKYHNQFLTRAPRRPDVPVEELETRVLYPDIWDAVTRFGLIFKDVFNAAWNLTYQDQPYASVWPTGQRFRLLAETTYHLVQETSDIIEGVE